jgi:16S rRNA (guanine527-N7)-methyltransferase
LGTEEQTETWQTLVKEKEYNDLLMEWNKKINLVSRKRADVFGLIEESKIFFPAIEFKKGIRIFDLGTGGGFPGIVIAIHYPEVKITMADSVQKKINAVSDIVRKLGLANAITVCGRAEDLSNLPDHKNKYDYVVARSVAVLQDLCRWSKELIKPGGKLITIKGGLFEGEIKAAGKMKYVKDILYDKYSDRVPVTVIFS